MLRRQLRRRERGQALVEFAMIAPILVMLIFGFVDLTRLYDAWVTIQGAAREGARYGVTGRTDCNAYANDRLNCIYYETKQRAKPLTHSTDNISVQVRRWDYPTYANPAAEGNPGEQCDALEVQVNYDFVATTPMVNELFGAIHIIGRERLVNEPFGTCS